MSSSGTVASGGLVEDNETVSRRVGQGSPGGVVKKRVREESPDVTEALRSIRAKGPKKGGGGVKSGGGAVKTGGGSVKKGGSEGSLSGNSSEEEEEVKGQRSSSGVDPEDSLSDFPPELDFMGGGGGGGSGDKSKRRTDRYHSSESSDSGVATLSPSTSDSTELTSPFSPCCDLSSDASSTISASSTSSCGDAPSSPECIRASSPPPTLHPVIIASPPQQQQIQIQQHIQIHHQQQQQQQHTILLGHPIMTTLALGGSNLGSQKVTASAVTTTTTTTSKVQTICSNNNNNNGIISFQIPTTNLSNGNNNQNTQLVSPFYANNPIRKSVAGTKVIPLLPKGAANSPSKTSCDPSRPAPPSRSPAKTPGGTPNRRNSTRAKTTTTTGGSAIKNIFATALNFHQKQQQQQKEKLENSNKTNSSNSNKSSSSIISVNNNNNNNNDNSTTINKNHPLPKATQLQSDLKSSSPLSKPTSPVLLKPESGTPSNKVILLGVTPPGSKSSKLTSPPADLQASQIIKKSLNLITNSVVKNATTDLLTPPKSSKPNVASSPSSAKKARLTTKDLKVITAEILGAALKVNADNNISGLKTVQGSLAPADPGPKKTDKSPDGSKFAIKLIDTPLSPLLNKSGGDSSMLLLSPRSKPDSPTSVVRNRKRKLKPEESSPSSTTSTSLETSSKSCTVVDVVGSSTISSTKKCVVVNKVVVGSVGGCVSSAECVPSPLTMCLSAGVTSASNFSISGGVVGVAALLKPVVVVTEGGCMWKGCPTTLDLCHNILEHIQTVHVESQEKTDGYHCLWEGCKVYDKKSSSLSWLVRHVVSHSGTKPFKCIFLGCGQSFGTQGALERHVNSHISTYGTAAHASSMAKSRLDNSPMKAARRKKQRCRKQRVNPGQYVDFFDKRVMEVIKHRLATASDSHTANAHDCSFNAEVVARRTVINQGPQVLVHWHPESIIPDEWILQKDFTKSKLVPLTGIPKERLVLLYPTLMPPVRPEKGSRKCRVRSSSTGSLTSSLSGSSSPFSMLSSPTPSPSSSASSTESTESGISDFFSALTKSDIPSYNLSKMETDDIDEGIAHCSRKVSKKQQQSFSKSNSSSKVEYLDEGLDDEETDWAMQLLQLELRSS